MRDSHHLRVVLLVLLASGFLMGWSEKWSSIKTEAAKINTVSARFIQWKHLKILSKPLKAEGVIYFKAPDSLRWEYTTPLRSVLLSHQGTTRRYFKKGDRFVPDASANLQVMQFVLVEIQRWLSGRFDENPDLTAELKGNGKIRLIANSKGLSAMINHIELQLSQRPGMIESVTIFEDQDSFTRLEFYNLMLNLEIKPSIFQEIE